MGLLLREIVHKIHVHNTQYTYRIYIYINMVLKLFVLFFLLALSLPKIYCRLVQINFVKIIDPFVYYKGMRPKNNNVQLIIL